MSFGDWIYVYDQSNWEKTFFFHGLWQMEQDKPPQFQREREREYIGDVIDINKWCNVS